MTQPPRRGDRIRVTFEGILADPDYTGDFEADLYRLGDGRRFSRDLRSIEILGENGRSDADDLMVPRYLERWALLAQHADLAGVDMAGKTTEQIVAEINEANRPFREATQAAMNRIEEIFDAALVHHNIPALLRRGPHVDR